MTTDRNGDRARVAVRHTDAAIVVETQNVRSAAVRRSRPIDAVTDIDAGVAVAERIGYPVLVRPSYVLGGRAMEVVHDERHLVEYVEAAVDVSPERPILVDRFLSNAIETEADAISDGVDAFVPSVMGLIIAGEVIKDLIKR